MPPAATTPSCFTSNEAATLLANGQRGQKALEVLEQVEWLTTNGERGRCDASAETIGRLMWEATTKRLSWRLLRPKTRFRTAREAERARTARDKLARDLELLRAGDRNAARRAQRQALGVVREVLEPAGLITIDRESIRGAREVLVLQLAPGVRSTKPTKDRWQELAENPDNVDHDDRGRAWVYDPEVSPDAPLSKRRRPVPDTHAATAKFQRTWTFPAASVEHLRARDGVKNGIEKRSKTASTEVKTVIVEDKTGTKPLVTPDQNPRSEPMPAPAGGRPSVSSPRRGEEAGVPLHVVIDALAWNVLQKRGLLSNTSPWTRVARPGKAPKMRFELDGPEHAAKVHRALAEYRRGRRPATTPPPTARTLPIPTEGRLFVVTHDELRMLELAGVSDPASAEGLADDHYLVTIDTRDVGVAHDELRARIGHEESA